MTIEPRCTLTSYLPSVTIASDVRYRVALDGDMVLDFAFAYTPAGCNYYQMYQVTVDGVVGIPPWMSLDQDRLDNVGHPTTDTPSLIINTADA